MVRMTSIEAKKRSKEMCSTLYDLNLYKLQDIQVIEIHMVKALLQVDLETKENCAKIADTLFDLDETENEELAYIYMDVTSKISEAIRKSTF